jgi:hypothetical protein
LFNFYCFLFFEKKWRKSKYPPQLFRVLYGPYIYIYLLIKPTANNQVCKSLMQSWTSKPQKG